jgi:ATP phosphoribosyltransferase
MPLQVANGNFDMAVTGKDWLTEHLEQFPGSPVKTLADLRYGWVRIVAAVSQDVPEGGIENLRQSLQGGNGICRVASEYVNIADRYARDNRLGAYRIIPTWGASEAFLPEDADLLIENTETGSTIARHNLRIIETLFESTACVIGRKEEASPLKAERLSRLVELFKKGVEAD